MTSRMAWLDWQRGLAVLFMIEVHVLGAWTAPEVASDTVHATLRWLGGLAAPGFLYMAGLSQVLADQSGARRGIDAATRRRAAVSRGLYVLGVAYVFRVAEYVLGFAFRVPGGWQGIFKVDILNIIGVALVLSALLVVGRAPRAHLTLAAGATVLVVAVTPWVAGLPTSAQLAGYLYMPGTSGFGLCNWAAFLFAGALVGALVARGVSASRLLAAGVALVALGLAAQALLPPYARADLGAASPPWFAVRLGETVALSGVLMLLPQALRGLEWLSLLGRRSLAAYMLSVELTYGLLLKRLHGRLEIPAVLAGIVGMILLTLVLIRLVDWMQRSKSTKVSV